MAALMIALLAVLLSVRSAGPSAGTILARAGSASPMPNTLLRQTFRVTTSAHGKSYQAILNVWETTVDGNFTVVEVEPTPNITAARYVESSGRVSRSWKSRRGITPILSGLTETPVATADGRLISARLQSAGFQSRWSVILTGEHVIDGRQAYLFRVRSLSAAELRMTIAISARTYRLVRLETPHCRAVLVATRVIPRIDTPELITTYIAAVHMPNPTESTETAAY